MCVRARLCAGVWFKFESMNRLLVAKRDFFVDLRKQFMDSNSIRIQTPCGWIWVKREYEGIISTGTWITIELLYACLYQGYACLSDLCGWIWVQRDY